MGFDAEAAQGVLEGFSAAKATLTQVPAEVAAQSEAYDQPTIAIEWRRRPAYAATPRSVLTPDRRHTLRWTDIFLGPLTIQVLDRAAYHSAVDVLRLAHSIAIAVCGERPVSPPTPPVTTTARRSNPQAQRGDRTYPQPGGAVPARRPPRRC